MPEQVTTPRVAEQPDTKDKENAALLGLAIAAASERLIAPAEGERFSTLGALGQLTPESLNEALANGPAAERALNWLDGLFRASDVIELRAVNPAGGGAVSYCGRLGDAAQRAEMLKFIRKYIGIWNVYFGLNPRRVDMAGTTPSRDSELRGNAANVVARELMLLDMDNKDAPDVDPDWSRTADELRALGPIGLVSSGNGFHVHLLYERIEGVEAMGEATVPLKVAMRRLGADDMSDPARIARLPYTVNVPNASKRKRGCVPVLALPLKLDRPVAAPRPLVEVCNDVKAIAERLGLPGRGDRVNAGDATAGATGHHGANGESKTGQPAPSEEALRVLMEELPNDGPFDSREDWIGICHAVKGAAQAAGIEAEGRDMFLDWSVPWGGDPDYDAEVWDTCRDPHVGYGTLKRELERTNPAGMERLRYAEARAVFASKPLTQEDHDLIASLAPLAAQVARGATAGGAPHTAMARALVAFTLAPTVAPAAVQIPPRKFLYGPSVIAGFISVVVAPGGTGKSALMMAEVLSMTSGKVLLGSEKPVRPLKVWAHNAEDPQDEQLRRLAAAQAHHNVTDADLGGRLFLTSGRDLPLCLARTGRDGPEVVQEAVDALVEIMLGAQVDVLVLDPLGAIHTLPENDNTAANVLMNALRQITDKTGAAIVLVHHTSKAAGMDMGAAGANAARGASAIVDAARFVRQLMRMSAEEARRFGVAEDERHNFVRVENGKSNMAPAEKARWRQLVSVPLNNGTAEYPAGDTVAVMEDWTPPGPVVGTPSDLHLVQNAIANASEKPRADNRATQWVGRLIADTLGMDIGWGRKAADRTPEQARNFRATSDMLSGWLADGGLRIVVERDPKSNRTVECIAVGELAIMQGDDSAKEAA